MGHQINGVELDNLPMGWTLQRASDLRGKRSRDRASLRRAGRDGVVPGLASTVSQVPYRFVMRSAPENTGALLALFGDIGIWSDGAREVPFEVQGDQVEALETADPRDEVTIDVLTPTLWRSKIASTASAALASASVPVTCFAGLSAPVQDAVIRLKGAANSIQVTDASGAWLTLPNTTAGQWVRFECDTGRAFQTATDVWDGGIEASGLVDFGGPRGVFEITPVIAAGDPTSRSGKLTVATASRSGAVFEVRGKAAYLL